MKVENKILVEISVWFRRKGKNVSLNESISAQNISSLEILELLSALETKFNLTFDLSKLSQADYFSLNSLSEALLNHSSVTINLVWYKVDTDIDLYSFKKWIEVQFHRKVKFKIVGEMVLVGIPDNDNYTDILGKIKKDVKSIEKYL